MYLIPNPVTLQPTCRSNLERKPSPPNLSSKKVPLLLTLSTSKRPCVWILWRNPWSPDGLKSHAGPWPCYGRLPEASKHGHGCCGSCGACRGLRKRQGVFFGGEGGRRGDGEMRSFRYGWWVWMIGWWDEITQIHYLGEFGIPRFAPSGPSGCISIYLVVPVDAGFPVYWLIDIGWVCYVERLGCKMVGIVDDGVMLGIRHSSHRILVDFGGQLGVFIQNQGPFSTSMTRTGGPCQQPIVVSKSRILGWSFWNERLMMIPSSCWEKQVLATWQFGSRWTHDVQNAPVLFLGVGGEDKIPLNIKMFHVDCQEVQWSLPVHGIRQYDNHHASTWPMAVWQRTRRRQTQNLSGASRLWNSRIRLYYPCRWSLKCLSLGGFCLFVICFR